MITHPCRDRVLESSAMALNCVQLRACFARDRGTDMSQDFKLERRRHEATARGGAHPISREPSYNSFDFLDQNFGNGTLILH